MTGHAQSAVDKRIAHIRQAYAQRLDMMTNQPFDEVKVEQMTVEYNRMYPGTGLYRHSDTYYWTDDENEEYMLKPTLYFVTSRYSLCHGMYNYTREYLLDAVTEQPMFMLITTQWGEEGERKEFRFYFDDHGKLIKQLPERIVIAENEQLLPPDVGIDEDGHANISSLMYEFDRVKTAFHTLIPTYPWQ